MAIEIEQFEDDGGSTLRSWYAYGHHDPAEFVGDLITHLLDEGEDHFPEIDWDGVEHRYMRRAGASFDGSWEAWFSREPKEGYEPVTTFDGECRRRGRSCVEVHCTNMVTAGLPVSVATNADEQPINIYIPVCSEHARVWPEPSYRICMIPVGATIVLEPESVEP